MSITVGSGVVARELGLTPRAARRLIATGLLPDVRPEGLHAARVDASAVADLAAWPYIAATELELIGPVVHVGPAFVRDDGSGGGWGVGPSGWEGCWAMGDKAACSAVGRLLVACISSFIPEGAVRRITDYQREGGFVTFETEPADDDERARIERHRFKATPGGVWQWANGHP